MSFTFHQGVKLG